MRIALIAHHVAPIAPPFAGGVESMTWYLSRWLAGRGHQVTLFAPPGSRVAGVDVQELELEPPLSRAARNDVAMPAPDFMGTHHAYQRLMLELAADGGGFDLVHSNSLHYLPVALAPLLDTPCLLTLHTPPTPWLESALRTPVSSGPRLSAVSAATARMWQPVVGVDHVVPNGVDLDAWPEGPGGTDAVWCGRMVPEKAPHLAIDAARACGMPLYLAGPIVDGAYFEREVAPRLGSDVHYAGHLAHRPLAALVGSSAVALATPDWDEPFGLSAAEAIATGTPVAAFDRGGLAEVIGRDGGRLAPPRDVGALAEAMAAACGMCRTKVRRHAVATLGIDAMGRGYEALYHRIAGRTADVAAEAA
jgi:glycosyltransferase involved in cell wall biosynthesis